KPVLRTDFMRRTGLGYEEKARHGQDFFHLLDFFLRGGKAAVADRAYYYYTQPFGAVSRQGRTRRAGATISRPPATSTSAICLPRAIRSRLCSAPISKS